MDWIGLLDDEEFNWAGFIVPSMLASPLAVGCAEYIANFYGNAATPATAQNSASCNVAEEGFGESTRVCAC